jgi:hypothetical protein
LTTKPGDIFEFLGKWKLNKLTGIGIELNGWQNRDEKEMKAAPKWSGTNPSKNEKKRMDWSNVAMANQPKATYFGPIE